VVSLVAYDAARTVIAQGNGVLVDAQGLILTTYHLAALATFVVVTRADTAPVFATTLVHTDRQWDLALIRISGQQLPILPMSETHDLAAGLPVVVQGQSEQGTLLRTEGTISAIQAVADTEGLLQLTVPSSAVQSGSLVLTQQGKVVGLVTPRVAASSAGGTVAASLPMLRHFLHEASSLQDERPFVILPSPGSLSGEATPPQVYAMQVRRRLQQQCAHLDFVDAVLSRATAIGVPIYNRGQHRECFSIYDAFSYKVLYLLGSQCGQVSSILRAALGQTLGSDDAAEQAWVLRRAFDLIHGVPPQTR
jgi:hypothetical protein